MQPDERDPTRAAEWLRRAKSNLARAKMPKSDPAILFEDMCFDAQQAVEKALKGVLVHLQVPFPKTHSIAELLALVGSAGIQIPPDIINEAVALTVYAVESRYPGLLEDIEESQYLEAVTIAERVVSWAELTVAVHPSAQDESTGPPSDE